MNMSRKITVSHMRDKHAVIMGVLVEWRVWHTPHTSSNSRTPTIRAKAGEHSVFGVNHTHDTVRIYNSDTYNDYKFPMSWR